MFCSGFANSNDMTFETTDRYHDADEDPFDKLKFYDIYNKNSNFNKYKEEFKQQINFTGTLYRYSGIALLSSTNDRFVEKIINLFRISV